jgi:hypothetical protein
MVEHDLAVADHGRAWVRDLAVVAAISPARGLAEPVAPGPAADKSIVLKAIGHPTETCRIPVVPVRAFSAPAAGKLPAAQVRARTSAVAPAGRGPALVRVRADVHRKDN